MRAWTTSACVVLAGSILSIPLAAVGTRGPVHPAPANTRIASSIEVTLTSTLPIAAPSVAASSPATRYVVGPGDTLSGIAAALGVPGGWPALYTANRHAIGPDPNTIRPGTVLVLPGQTAPARYTVSAGDTLSGIAAALGVPGGWPALYTANRHAIGHDPSTIRPGVILTVPRPAATVPAPPARPSPRPSHRRHAAAPPAHRRHAATRPSSAAGPRHHSRPVAKVAAAPPGMPSWLKTVLAAVGLFILAAFLT
jgi:LysM repeat protein